MSFLGGCHFGKACSLRAGNDCPQREATALWRADSARREKVSVVSDASLTGSVFNVVRYHINEDLLIQGTRFSPFHSIFISDNILDFFIESEWLSLSFSAKIRADLQPPLLFIRGKDLIS
jgi:hypothetical protein